MVSRPGPSLSIPLRTTPPYATAIRATVHHLHTSRTHSIHPSSALGYITGDQSKMNEGNIRHEAAEWEYSAADGKIPVPSLERAKGKVESAVGMVTGDIEKQKDGNVRAQKAAFTQG